VSVRPVLNKVFPWQLELEDAPRDLDLLEVTVAAVATPQTSMEANMSEQMPTVSTFPVRAAQEPATVRLSICLMEVVVVAPAPAAILLECLQSAIAEEDLLSSSPDAVTVFRDARNISLLMPFMNPLAVFNTQSPTFI